MNTTLATVALLAATSFSSACSQRVKQPEAQTSHATVAPTLKAEPPTSEGDLADVIEQTMPSVVGLSTWKTVDAPKTSPVLQGSPTPPTPGVRHGVGSGVIVSKDGLIMTNNHVVQGAEEITVRLDDDRTFSAKIVGTDRASDVALVRIDDPPKDLAPVKIGDSDRLRLGQTVLAIGNPFGLQSTVTMGIVSAKGRANVGIVDFEDFIQTDAAINPGNSGGALINREGELVGINTAILSRSGGYQGIGFAIPSKMAQSVMKDLLDGGEVRRGFLGVNIQTLDEDLAHSLGIDHYNGVVVAEVQSGSPAEASGIQVGDVITHLDDKAVRTALEVRNAVAMQPPGEVLDAKVLRDGDPITVKVTLGQRDGGPGQAVLAGGGALDGLSFQPLDSATRKKFGIGEAVRFGIVISGVQPGSSAALAGLRQGDIILGVGRTAVKSVVELKSALNASRPLERLALRIARDGDVFYVVIGNGQPR